MPFSTITSLGHPTAPTANLDRPVADASCRGAAPSGHSPGGIVVAFTPRADARLHLTMRDRLSVAHWNAALPPGSYRLVIHPRLPGDPPELGDMALVYRPSDPWAAWGFTRQGALILAWNCVTGVDAGRFAEMDEALAALLGPASQPAAAPIAVDV